MAIPASTDEEFAQLAQWQERLRLVPPEEVPPPEYVREQVHRWDEHVQTAADTIRWADAAIERLQTWPAELAADRDRLEPQLREARTQAFELMRRLNPDQAWFWTEKWQAGQRRAEARAAAGQTGPTYYSDVEFEAALRAHMRDAHP